MSTRMAGRPKTTMRQSNRIGWPRHAQIRQVVIQSFLRRQPRLSSDWSISSPALQFRRMPSYFVWNLHRSANEQSAGSVHTKVAYLHP